MILYNIPFRGVGKALEVKRKKKVILSYERQEMKDNREIGENSEYIEWFLKVLTGQVGLVIGWFSLGFKLNILSSNFFPVVRSSPSRE